METATLMSVAEYMRTSFSPDCDYVDGQLMERNLGKKRHSYTQLKTGAWFDARRKELNLEPFVEQRLQVGPQRFRIPDLLVFPSPSPDEEVFTSAPYK